LSPVARSLFRSEFRPEGDATAADSMRDKSFPWVDVWVIEVGARVGLANVTCKGAAGGRVRVVAEVEVVVAVRISTEGGIVVEGRKVDWGTYSVSALS
jgi:hypothetical protein